MEQHGLVAAYELMKLETCRGNANSSCLERVKNTLQDFCGAMGFQDMVFTQRSMFNRDDPSKTTMLMSSYPEDWMNEYFSSGYEEIDPLARCSNMGESLYLPKATRKQAYDMALSNPLGDSKAARDDYIAKVKQLWDRALYHNRASGLFITMQVNYEIVFGSFSSSLDVFEFEETVDDFLWHQIKVALHQASDATNTTYGCGECGRDEVVPLTASEIGLLSAFHRSPMTTLAEFAEKNHRKVNTIKSCLRMIREKLDLPDTIDGWAIAYYCISKKLLSVSDGI